MGLDVGRYSEAIVGGSAIEHWKFLVLLVSIVHHKYGRWTAHSSVHLQSQITNKNESRLITTYTTSQLLGYIADYQQCTWLLLSRLHNKITRYM